MPIEPGLVDTDVLAYALNVNAAYHASSHALLETGRAASVTLYVTSQTIRDFIPLSPIPGKVGIWKTWLDGFTQ